jgi:hypothetical protein
MSVLWKDTTSSCNSAQGESSCKKYEEEIVRLRRIIMKTFHVLITHDSETKKIKNAITILEREHWLS